MHRRGSGVIAAVLSLLFVALALPGSPASASAPDRQDRGQSEHQRVVEFWTHARVAQAKPRDFVYDHASGRFVPNEHAKGGKPGGGDSGGTSVSVTGASWSGGGAVVATTGKVLFALGSSYYVCSGSVAGPADGKSVILTAAHCVYDHGTGYASNWVFIPDYDSAPAPLSTSNSNYCADTAYGCWSASSSAMHVRKEYIDAGAFNSAAIVYDFAFVRVGAGGKTGVDPDLDDAVGSQTVGFSTSVDGETGYAFGYPAGGKYHGTDLTYCAGPIGADRYQDRKTYALGCDMTGGSSGGPWFAPFSGGSGSLVSVNSYGYSGIKKMHGPKLGSAATQLYGAATA